MPDRLAVAQTVMFDPAHAAEVASCTSCFVGYFSDYDTVSTFETLGAQYRTAMWATQATLLLYRRAGPKTAQPTASPSLADDSVRLGDNVSPSGWLRRTADNGRGTVWQTPGATGNANMVRVMEPTNQYPNGYARFYSQFGQPINLAGKSGPRAQTHIALKMDDTLQVPTVWPQ